MKFQLGRRREMRPMLFKLGIAFALSLVGYLTLRPRRGPSPSPPDPPTDPKPSIIAAAGLKDELHILSHEEALSRIINGSSPRTTTTTTTTFMDLSCKMSGDEEGFLLPESNQLLLKEFDASEQDPESAPTTLMSTKSELEERSVMGQEIAYLRNLVGSLQERERTLEIQLLRYHGLREQEASMKELESRVKINATESKILSLKVESLQDENRRLQAQLSDYSTAVMELESARAKIRLLKRKVILDEEQAEEKITALQLRLTMLQDKVYQDGRESAKVVENLKRLKELEEEAMDLRNAKSRLTQENFELKLKLRSMQMPTSSALKAPEAELLEEASHLRDQNNKLKKDIEQLHNDRYTDVEELVYLRWINACLRYELRNYQPVPGKTVARDLSKSLSPESERKAKQLIVEYANLNIDHRNMSVLDFDSDCCSSQASTEEPSDSSKSSNSRKSKFIGKLKKLVLGKGHHNEKSSERRRSVSPCSFDDASGRVSNDSLSSCTSVDLASVTQSTGLETHVSERWLNKGYRPPRSLDISRPGRPNLEEAKLVLGERCKSDVGLLSGDVCLIDLSPNRWLDLVDVDVPEKVELTKLAKALESSRGSSKSKKRAASLSLS